MKPAVSDWIRLSRRIEDKLYSLDHGTGVQVVVAFQFVAEGLLEGDHTHPNRTVEFITAALQTREEFDRFATAHHEAAHAVVGALRGHRVIRLSVGMEAWRDVVAQGICEFDPPIAPIVATTHEDWHAIGDYIVMNLAGPAAHARISHPKSPMVADQWASHRASCREVAGRIFPRLTEAKLTDYLGRLEAIATAEVAEHWGAIRTVADALQRSGRLDEAEFYALLHPPTSGAVTRLTAHDACCVHAGQCTAEVA